MSLVIGSHIHDCIKTDLKGGRQQLFRRSEGLQGGEVCVGEGGTGLVIGL
jgi:hypothetical protein